MASPSSMKAPSPASYSASDVVAVGLQRRLVPHLQCNDPVAHGVNGSEGDVRQLAQVVGARSGPDAGARHDPQRLALAAGHPLRHESLPHPGAGMRLRVASAAVCKAEDVRQDLIIIQPHSPEWAEAFEAQKAAVKSALAGGLVAPIEHIGSTSVPGLPAKPIIDMLAVIDDYEAFAPALLELERIRWVPAPEPGDAGRRRDEAD